MDDRSPFDPQVAGTAYLLGLTSTPGPIPDTLRLILSPFGGVEVFSEVSPFRLRVGCETFSLRIAFRTPGVHKVWYVRKDATRITEFTRDIRSVQAALDRYAPRPGSWVPVPGWDAHAGPNPVDESD